MGKTARTPTLRLDRYVATVTDFSRNDVKKWIKAGEVTVAGRTITEPSTPVSPGAAVALAGQPLRSATRRYFMLNKPPGYVCANRDRRHATVMELLAEDNVENLHLAGRLDIDTTGLVLITDDGAWSHRIMSPRHECWKRYRVETEEPIAPETAARFEKGVFLKSEKHRTRPARLTVLQPKEALIEICEGKYHQVKRMFEAVGNRVVSLHREAVGGVELDPDLAEGEYRELTAEEVERLS